MAQVIIKGSEKAIAEFCSWFSNSGEQGLMEAWADSGWNPKTMKYEDVNTYLSTRGYSEVIELVEYDKETDEEVPYFDGEKLSGVQLMGDNTGQIFNLNMVKS